MQLAEKYGMGVILVMHAAPGSQNGQDNGAPFKQGQHAWDTANPQPVLPRTRPSAFQTHWVHIVAIWVLAPSRRDE